MIKDAAVQKILKEYDDKHLAYSAFTAKQEHLITEVLQGNSLSPHSITSRVKCRQSLQDKIRKSDAEYEQLNDVTDISGVRVTTYFNDEVDKVAAFLDKEFEIVKEHSVDKRKMLDADRFGYVTVAESRNADYALRFLNAEKIGDEDHNEIAKNLFDVFERIK